jgi:hypothetical protein
MNSQPFQDGAQHALPFSQHLPVVETQHVKTMAPKLQRALLIRLHCFRREMLSAVQFNHQASFETCEVGEEGADGALAPELVASKSAVAQRIPKLALGFG